MKMRGLRIPAISVSPSLPGQISAANWRRYCSPTEARSRPTAFENGTSRNWDRFYRRHQNKFFKDRHYLEKEWGHYFADAKVVLEVGCGAGNTVFPLLAAYPDLFVHACDFSSQAIELIKAREDFQEDQTNAFVCDVATEDLCDRMMPSSVDVITLIFTLSAACPKNMPLMLNNMKKVLKPNGHILLRDYATGDYAQEELHKRNQMISDDFYIRGDGTYAFYFSQEYLSTLFSCAGFSTIDMDIYSRQIQNRSQNITMSRRWVQATFKRTPV